MTEPDPADTISGLITQRDAALAQAAQLDAENRALRHHQQDIREWLAGEINKFAQARDDPERVLDVADEIHATATDKLGDVESYLTP